MRRTTLRRLEALEKEHRSREQKQLASLQEARVYIWMIVLAYYLGGLEPDEKEEGPREADEEEETAIYVRHLHRPWEAYARALKYPSWDDYFEAGFIKKDVSEFLERFDDARRRLFANVGLDFDSAPPNILFDAVVTMVNQLPDQWLNWLRSNLQEWCSGAEIAAGSNLPRWLSGDNFFTSSKPSGA
jgi:hypothetical protein